MTRSGIAKRLDQAIARATAKCPSLKTKSISPHVLRHTAAMEFLQAGVDRSLIAIWLGHESVETTQIYLDANLAIKEEILALPTFFEHYDSVSVDWRYLHDRAADALQYESRWLKRQGVRVYVDLASGVNLFPDLRLVNNDPERFAESMAVVDDVLSKMEALGAHDLLLTPNRAPENSFNVEQTRKSFQETLAEICKRAEKRSITVYLRFSTKLHGSLEEYARYVADSGATNLLLAPSIATLAHQQRGPDTVSSDTQRLIGLWLASAPGYDVARQPWTYNAPVRTLSDPALVAQYAKLTPGKPVLFDVAYESADEEYLDWRFLEGRR